MNNMISQEEINRIGSPNITNSNRNRYIQSTPTFDLNDVLSVIQKATGKPYLDMDDMKMITIKYTNGSPTSIRRRLSGSQISKLTNKNYFIVKMFNENNADYKSIGIIDNADNTLMSKLTDDEMNFVNALYSDLKNIKLRNMFSGGRRRKTRKMKKVRKTRKNRKTSRRV